MIPPLREDAPHLREYTEALEAIIRSLPGQVTINGTAYSNEDGIAALRGHFDVNGLHLVGEAPHE